MATISLIILKLFGWSVEDNLPEERFRCVMIAAPHTSNWDFIIARLAFFVIKVPVKFTIKNSWMRFPMNLIIGPLGGIGIDRRPKDKSKRSESYTDQMARAYQENEQLAIMVTPEGTRAKRTKWKTGFYYVAQKAEVPICLGYVDYKRKMAGVGKFIPHTVDYDQGMKEITAFYKTITPRFPEKYALDERYADVS